MAVPFAFQIHHIFPVELLLDPTIAERLASLLAETNFTMDMAGNEIALFSDPQDAAYVRALTGVDGKNIYYESGFGSSLHIGSHPGYTQFLILEIDTILDSSASPQTQLAEVYKLHFFARQLSQGLVTIEGQTLGVMGTTEYAANLASAYDSWTVTDTSLEAYITGLDRTLTDVGVDHNLQARLDAVTSLINHAHDAGHLTIDQYNIAISRISAVQLGLSESGGYQNDLSGQIEANKAITQISIVANFEVKNNLGSDVSIKEFLSYHITNFAVSEDGYIDANQFDKAMADISNFSNLLAGVSDRLPGDLSHLDQATIDRMAAILDSKLVGLGGGLLGDTVEFLNLSYDAIKTGIQTGDWSDLVGVIANYGVSAALSAVAITTTVAIAGEFSVAAAAVVAAAWAVGGVIDAISNGAQLLDKILTDLGLLDPNDLPGWYTALSLLFNPPSCEPLVIDLDGDGIELTSLGASTAYFDLDGDGFAERTGWVGPDDGLLVLDENGNGRIDDIAELFGSQTSFGYQELRLLDSNGDNVIDANDAAFHSLQIWKDANGDGSSSSDELHSLTDHGVRSLSLEASPSGAMLSGNRVLSTSHVTWNDGAVTQSAEIVFALSQFQSSYIVPENFAYSADVYDLPKLAGYGDVPGLWVAMTQDSSLKAEAQALIEVARSGNFSEFLGGMDHLLFNWADVENVQWMEEIDNLLVYFAYDPDELADYLGDGYGNSSSPPIPKGYVFSPENIDPGKLHDWLEENNLALAPGSFANGLGLKGMILNPTATFTSSGGRGGTQIFLSPSDEEDELPSIPAPALALLQKMMGQDYRIAGNFIAPGSIMVGEPTSQSATALMKSFSELKDYYTAHFLAQSAWSVIAREGLGADLGSLAPFKHVFINPLNQHICGDVRSFALQLVEMFRSHSLGSDSSALALLSVFKDEMPSLASQVVELFDDIDRSFIVEAFDLNSIVEGTNDGESLSTSVAALMAGHDGNDSLTGSGGNDTLSGGRGDDSLFGLNGNDTYVYARGDGNDTITEAANKGTADMLSLIDLNPSDVTLASNGNDVTFIIAESAAGAGDAGSVLLKDTVDDWFSQGIDQVVFADGTVWSRSDIRTRLLDQAGTAGNDNIAGFNTADRLIGRLGNDALNGGDGNDTYVYARGDGNDTITEAANKGAADTLSFTDINPAAVSLVRNGIDVTIVIAESTPGAGDGGSVLLKDTLDDYVYRGVEKVVFADGTSWTRAQLRDMLLTSTAGNETFNGFSGNDTFRYSRGGGQDTIIEAANAGSGDQLLFTDINPAAVSLVRNGNDVTIVIAESTPGAGDGGSVLLKNNLEDYFNQGVDKVTFADGVSWTRADLRSHISYVGGTSGNETITGTTGADTIQAGAGDDTLVSLAGNDTFVFRSNFGHDTLTDFAAGAGSVDVIDLGSDVFADFASVMAAATQVGADTLITHDANNSILLKNVALANLHQDDFRFTATA